MHVTSGKGQGRALYSNHTKTALCSIKSSLGLTDRQAIIVLQVTDHLEEGEISLRYVLLYCMCLLSFKASPILQ